MSWPSCLQCVHTVEQTSTCSKINVTISRFLEYSVKSSLCHCLHPTHVHCCSANKTNQAGEFVPQTHPDFFSLKHNLHQTKSSVSRIRSSTIFLKRSRTNKHQHMLLYIEVKRRRPLCI